MEDIEAKCNDFLSGFLDYTVERLTSITRYNTRKFIKPQSVMQHLGSTTLIAMLLSDYFNKVGIKNNTEEVMRMAIIHDADEVVSGDIPHDAKYEVEFSKELRETLNKLTNYTMHTMLGMIKDKEIEEKYMKLYDDEKVRTSVEAKIAKLADIGDVIIYARHEKKLGNVSMSAEENNASKGFKSLLASILAENQVSGKNE
jgi:5'-deoxynucleotidase YfbR-like HD superfamily hydrolase